MELFVVTLIKKAMITGATYNPEYNFNVCSITKRLQSGWVLFGNDTNNIPAKSNKKIKFDAVIPMPCGAIYACYFYL